MLKVLVFVFVSILSGARAHARTCDDPASLDSLILAQMALNHIPGLSASVVKGESVVWQRAYGFARLEDSIRAADSTVFDLASVSKTATGVALMQLWERGVFSLDEDVNGFLPFSVRHPRYPDSAITFRMLLTHTSGIADHWPTFQRLQRQGDPDVPLRRFVEGYLVPGGEFYDSTNNFCSWPPGADYRYCNLAIALAGFLVEANVDSFHLYTRDSLFRPLGMSRTVWYFRDIDTNAMAMPYRFSGGRYVRYGHQSLPDVPAGTMKSSSPELVRFAGAMMSHGCWQGVRILDSATAGLMTTVQHPAGVGLVFHRSNIGTREVWGHGGMWNGISTRIAFCRAESSGVVVLCNMEGAYGAIEGVILPALFDRAAAATERGPVPGGAGPEATVLVGELALPVRSGTLLDATGRKVMELRVGPNELRHLAPGIYFVRSEPSAAGPKPSVVRKVIVTR